MVDDEYELEGDEYEVVDTGEPRQIKSDLVKRKLDGRYPFPIEQDDFEDYTLSDYLTLEGERGFPTSLVNDEAEAARVALEGAALSVAAAYVLDPSASTAVLSGYSAALGGEYHSSLSKGDAELKTAAQNSLENFRELF